MKRVDDKVKQLLVGLLIVGAFFISATLSSRLPTNASNDTRVVLCTGIIANVANTARDDTSVIALCDEVGVHRSEYGPTVRP
jgi:hypothetical protein